MLNGKNAAKEKIKKRKKRWQEIISNVKIIYWKKHEKIYKKVDKRNKVEWKKRQQVDKKSTPERFYLCLLTHLDRLGLVMRLFSWSKNHEDKPCNIIFYVGRPCRFVPTNSKAGRKTGAYTVTITWETGLSTYFLKYVLIKVVYNYGLGAVPKWTHSTR
jgi:hypothetical protein